MEGKIGGYTNVGNASLPKSYSDKEALKIPTARPWERLLLVQSTV